jgi:hypothetical protein
MAVKRKRKKQSQSVAGRKLEVKAEIANFTLAKAKSALTLQIYSRKKKLGELQVGRGSLYWAGANRQKEKRIAWGRFADMMNLLAYGEK